MQALLPDGMRRVWKEGHPLPLRRGSRSRGDQCTASLEFRTPRHQARLAGHTASPSAPLLTPEAQGPSSCVNGEQAAHLAPVSQPVWLGQGGSDGGPLTQTQ